MLSAIKPGAFGALDDDFCRYETASIAVLPVPYDGTSLWMKRSDFDPEAMIDASAHY
jgi:agmatinase